MHQINIINLYVPINIINYKKKVKIFAGLLYFIGIYYNAKIFNNIIVIVLP